MATFASMISEQTLSSFLTFAFLLSLLLLVLFRGPADRFYSFRSSSPVNVRLLPSSPSPNPESGDGEEYVEGFDLKWNPCRGGNGVSASDIIPCLDNWKAIKALKTRRHMEHRERHCPSPPPRCLVPLPPGYHAPVLWPRSRDMVWYDNVPHPKLIEYKKEQNWVRRSGDYLVFPGGGTQFKYGVSSYIKFIEEILPTIEWGKHTRVVLDVGSGVASFGGHLLDKGVITMSFAPKDEHEAQIQFALERGIPAFLSVIGTQKLPFPDNVFDLIHCARCRVHWHADGGKPLLELNRILRPGGFFVWSATPVYRDDTRDKSVWEAMRALTTAICWKMVVKSKDASGIGVVIYQKPLNNSCYAGRKLMVPQLCSEKEKSNVAWYTPLESCLPMLLSFAAGQDYEWPKSWPTRLKTLSSIHHNIALAEFIEDTSNWENLVSNIYLHDLGISWDSIRNVMDMNAGFGGFAAALASRDLWVMNTVPVHAPNTLSTIYDRGMIGVYHDWCESFNTYPRTYDLLHASFLLGNLTQRCDIMVIAAEIDRILRPGGYVVFHDDKGILKKLHKVLQSLQWDANFHVQEFLVGKKSFWRPI